MSRFKKRIGGGGLRLDELPRIKKFLDDCVNNIIQNEDERRYPSTVVELIDTIKFFADMVRFCFNRKEYDRAANNVREIVAYAYFLGKRIQEVTSEC